MNSILSFIYEQSIKDKAGSGALVSLMAKCFRLLRRLILGMGDPLCKMNIWGRTMWMPFSHELPGCLATERHYDDVLKRAADFIRAKHGAICGIDVGANIGDTIAATIKAGQDRFLGVEPNPVFYKCLERNVADIPNVQVLKAACSTHDGAKNYSVTTARGTATMQESGSEGLLVQTNRLDTIIASRPEFRNCNFLKTDTDGHDFDVLLGAQDLIRTMKPAVLFECEMRGNPEFIGNFLSILQFFETLDYRYAFIYDSCGELFGVLPLQDTAAFARMLFYQVTSGKINYDVLLVQDSEAFLERELQFFITETRESSSRKVAEQSAALMTQHLKNMPKGAISNA